MNLSKHKQLISDFSVKVDRLWNRVAAITLTEVLKKEVDLAKMDESCTQMQRISSQLSTAVNSAISDADYDEPEVEEQHTQMEQTLSQLDAKLDLIDQILTNLTSIQWIFEEANGADLFDLD